MARVTRARLRLPLDARDQPVIAQDSWKPTRKLEAGGLAGLLTVAVTGVWNVFIAGWLAPGTPEIEWELGFALSSLAILAAGVMVKERAETRGSGAGD